MPFENLYTLIAIDEHSASPKYLQVVNSIVKAIEDGKLSKGYCMPSINELSYELDISRDTCIRVYKELKKLGAISSFPGKGYFISAADLQKRVSIFLLFNKLSTHKKIIYDSFVAALGVYAAIDFYIYNNDFLLFKELLSNRKKEYSYYVIIPHFLEGGEEDAPEIINTLPKDRLIIMDKLLPGISGNYGAVYENFEKDIYTALVQALPQLIKYHTLHLIFPEYTYHPKEILKGFAHFCDDYAFNHTVIHYIEKESIRAGEVYINLMEDDLVTLIEKIWASDLEIGKNVGVISYNETAIKKIILNGITTISTDFKMIGEKAASLILNNSAEHIEADFYLTLRNSL